MRSNPQAKQAVALANNSSGFQTTGTRRSKRTRKCKGDLDVLASSYDTIKKVKIKVSFFNESLMLYILIYKNLKILDCI